MGSRTDISWLVSVFLAVSSVACGSDGDGGSVFRMVRDTDPESRTVLITGYRADMDQLVAQLLAEGADAVQYKPFHIPDLIETLGKLAVARDDDAGGARR